MDEFPGNPPNPPLSGGRGGISEIFSRFGRKIIPERLKAIFQPPILDDLVKSPKMSLCERSEAI
jgi:hypothetical protein